MSWFRKEKYARVVAVGKIEFANKTDIKPFWGYVSFRMETNLAWLNGDFQDAIGEDYFIMDSYIRSFSDGKFSLTVEEAKEKMDTYVEEVRKFLGETGSATLYYGVVTEWRNK